MFNEQTRHITMLIAYAEALYFKTNTYQRLVCNYALLTEWQMYHFLKKIWSYISDRRMKFVKKWEKDLWIDMCAEAHRRYKNEAKIIFKRFYISCYWPDYFVIWQCRHKICITAIFIESDRFVGNLRYSHSLRFYSCDPAVACWGHCGGQSE